MEKLQTITKFSLGACMSKSRYISLIWLVLMFTGCAIRLIAPYDPVTDEKISDLQEVVVVKFTEWGREIPPVVDEYPFYDHTEAVLEILISRNQNIEKSEIIVQMLQRTKDNISLIKESHEKGQLDKAFLDEVKPDIMAQFIAIQRFQMALKREGKN